MRSLTWMGLGLSCVLVLCVPARSTGDEKGATAKPVLDIMSLDQGDCTLGLSFPWGAMAVNHVQFNDHSGPFKVVVESSGTGVRVNFDGWGKESFVASADKVRIIYWVAGRKEIEFDAEAISAKAVRVRPAGRPAAQGRRVVVRFGDRAAKGVATVSVAGRRD
jgi:hypothetical protein